MWLLKLKIKHDCCIGSRCKKFSCQSYSIPLTQWSKSNYEYVLGQHILLGEQKDINNFVKDLKKDPRTVNLEREENIIYLLERSRNIKIPARIYSRSIFFVKPVYVDKDGYEYWEVASFEKSILTKYLSEIKKQREFEVELQNLSQSRLKFIWYEKTMPPLTEKQKKAFELAVEYGYYKFPRKINLEKLSKLMKISISTYQEHLRVAESKIIPSLK